MSRRTLLLALLLSGAAVALDPQTVTPAGTTAKSAQGVQGVTNGLALHIACDSGCGGAATFSDNGVFTAGATSVGIAAGVFNDSITALTSGSAGAPRLTSKRALHFNLRDASGNEIPFPAALVSGGLNVNVGNASLAVTQSTSPWIVGFNGTAQPVTDSTHSNITADYDTSAGTQTMTMYGIGFPASGGAAAWPGDGTNGGKVQVSTAIPAGTNVVGKVGIDQTTPGTTNAVQVTNSFALEATQTNGSAKAQQVDASGNVQPAGDTDGHAVHVLSAGASSYTAARLLVTGSVAAAALPSAAARKVCFSVLPTSPDAAWLGSDATANPYSNATALQPGDPRECREIANANQLYFYSTGGALVAYEVLN